MVLLDEIQNKNRFLTKIGIYGFIYILVCLATTIFIRLDLRSAKQIHRMLFIDEYLWILLCVSIGIKVICGFFGSFLKFLLNLMYLLDLLLCVVLTIGVYLYLEEY